MLNHFILFQQVLDRKVHKKSNHCNSIIKIIYLYFSAVKAKNVVSLSVNKVFVEPGIGIGGAWRTDVNNPLYVGGHPEIEKLYGQHRLDTAQNFIGCIRDIEINSNGKPEDFPITVDKAYGNVTVGICSTI